MEGVVEEEVDYTPQLALVEEGVVVEDISLVLEEVVVGVNTF